MTLLSWPSLYVDMALELFYHIIPDIGFTLFFSHLLQAATFLVKPLQTLDQRGVHSPNLEHHLNI